MPKVAYEAPMSLGIGVDSVSELVRGKAVENLPYHLPIDELTEGVKRISYSKVCSSQHELAKEMELNVDAGFKFNLVGKLELDVDFLERNAVKSNSVCIIVKSVSVRLPKLLTDVKLTDKARDVYVKDPKLFLNQFGDYYVYGFETGGIFYGAISIEFKDEEEKRNLSAGLSAKFNIHVLNLQAEGDFKKKLLEYEKFYHVKIDSTSSGYHVNSADNVDDLFLFKKKFEDKITDAKSNWILSAHLMDYVTLGLPDGGSSLTKIQIQRGDKMARYHELTMTINSQIEKIDDIVSHPEIYPSQDSEYLKNKKTELIDLKYQITPKILSCLRDLDCSFDQTNVEIPRVDLPKKKESAQQYTSSNIIEKYKTIKEKNLLGTPIGVEEKCSDNIGLFQNYENGVIYWHPIHGGHEIHGLNYRKYKSIGLEKSELGYPVSDEESDKFGRHWNMFEKGKIQYSNSIPVAEVTYFKAKMIPYYKSVTEPIAGAFVITNKFFAVKNHLSVPTSYFDFGISQ